MDDAIERVARAICREIERPGVDYSKALGVEIEASIERHWPNYKRHAIAAIAARDGENASPVHAFSNLR